jgi:hypothetical protein
MRLSLATGLLTALALTPTTGRADLVISGAAAAAVPVTTADTSPPTDAPADAHSMSTDPAPAPHPSAPAFLMARGFGHAVPLSFAVRQIVPKTVKVSFGPGANPDARVNWTGGRGWNWVLFDAVRPLGLHLVMSHMAVEIRK